MVLCLISRSLNNFEFIFVYGIRECFNFADLHVVVQLSQNHLPLFPTLYYSLGGLFFLQGFLMFCCQGKSKSHLSSEG